MLGKIAEALTPIDSSGGKVFVEGEYWTATKRHSDQPGRHSPNHRRRRIDWLKSSRKSEEDIACLKKSQDWWAGWFRLLYWPRSFFRRRSESCASMSAVSFSGLANCTAAKGPGLIFLIPVVDRMVKMDLRVVTIDVARQELMTRDNVPVTVDAVVYFRVVDPEAAVIRVENYLKATSLISQTTLRSVLGQAELDELLAEREKINLTLQEIIDRQTDPWGIKVTSVEVKDVVLPDGMKRAMARQAETERERRAKIINAEGEFQAAEKLVQAAAMISEQPIALQLRFLQTMKEISSEHNTTTFLPVPIDLFTPFLEKAERPMTKKD